jgi:phage terminase small subunit
MTQKQRRFADDYLVHLDSTRAYKMAYSKDENYKWAVFSGKRLLRDTKVKEYIKKRIEKISGEKIADVTEVLEFLTAVLRGNPTERQQLKAAELLGKRYQIFSNNAKSGEAVTVVFNGEEEIN